MSCWVTTPSSTNASWARIWGCWLLDGKTSTIRLIDSKVLFVCNVARQRWPGLRDRDRGRDGFPVAHLTHQDYVGILPEYVLQRVAGSCQ